MFKESDRSFGVFYPRNYIVAGFGSLERAQEVQVQLRQQGFALDNVIALPGMTVIRQLEADQGEGWLDRLKVNLAQALGTEVGYLDDDKALADQGGAFLFVYVPKDEEVLRARRTIEAAHPVLARRYMALGIERYTYPPQSALPAGARAAVRAEQGTG